METICSTLYSWLCETSLSGSLLHALGVLSIVISPFLRVVLINNIQAVTSLTSLTSVTGWNMCADITRLSFLLRNLLTVDLLTVHVKAVPYPKPSTHTWTAYTCNSDTRAQLSNRCIPDQIHPVPMRHSRKLISYLHKGKHQSRPCCVFLRHHDLVLSPFYAKPHT